jgi:hypothetical protein
VSASEPKKPSWFDTNRLRILWTGVGSVAAVLASIAVIYEAVAPKDRPAPSAAPTVRALLTKLELGERVSRGEYMTRPEFQYAVDPMHTSADQLSAEEAARMGSVMYYTVDIFDSRAYDVKYEPWDRRRHPIAPVRQLRGIIPSDKPFQDTQSFWVAEDPKIAGIRLILAPNIPPPLMSDAKTVHADGSVWP